MEPSTAAELARDDDEQPREDHFVVLRHVRWADYLRLLEIRGEGSVPRMTYREGVLELMTPAFEHEVTASLIGRLVEAYCMDRDLDILPVGSWTIKRRKDERGAEPDECYVFGIRKGRPKRPDVAIEVIRTAPLLDKLDVYRKLGVPEVWVWQHGVIQVHRLHGKSYRRAPRSRFLPDLDLALLCRFLDRPSVTRAVRDFRAALAKRPRRAH